MDLWGDCVWFQMRLYSWCVWWPFKVLFINSLLIVHGCSAKTPFATDSWSGTTSCALCWNLWCVPEGRKHCLVSLWTSWHPWLEIEEKPFMIQRVHHLCNRVSSGTCLQVGFAWPSLPFGFSFPISFPHPCPGIWLLSLPTAALWLQLRGLLMEEPYLRHNTRSLSELHFMGLIKL